MNRYAPLISAKQWPENKEQKVLGGIPLLPESCARYTILVRTRFNELRTFKSVWDYVHSRQNDDLTPEDLDEIPPDEETYRHLWRVGRDVKRTFIANVFVWFTALTKEEFDRHGGINHKSILNMA